MQVYKDRIGSASELCRFANSVVMMLTEQPGAGAKPSDLKEVWQRALEVLEPGPHWDAFSKWPESSTFLFDPDISRAMIMATRDVSGDAGEEQRPEDRQRRECLVRELKDAVQRLMSAESLERAKDDAERVIVFFERVADRALAQASQAREEFSMRIYGVPSSA